MPADRPVAGPWPRTAVALAAAVPVLGTLTAFGAQLGAIAATFGVGPARAVLPLTLATVLQFVVGAVAGPATDRFGPRPVLLVAAGAYGVGLAAASISTNLMGVTLGIGLGTGVAAGCVLTPLLARVASWFTGARPVAVGLMSAAGSLGGLLLAPTGVVIDAVGLRVVWRLLALAVPLLVVTAALLLPAAPSGQARRPVRSPVRRLLSERPVRRFYAAGVLSTAAVFVTPALLVPTTVAQGVTPVTAGLLLSTAHLSTVVGKLVVAPLLPVRHGLAGYRGAQVTIACSFLLWMAAGASVPALVAVVVVYGVGTGAWAALTPVLLSQASEPAQLGGLLGLIYTAPAFGALGPLLAAAGAVHIGIPATLALSAGVLLLGVRLLRPLPPPPRPPSASGTRTSAAAAPALLRAAPPHAAPSALQQAVPPGGDR